MQDHDDSVDSWKGKCKSGKLRIMGKQKGFTCRFDENLHFT